MNYVLSVLAADRLRRLLPGGRTRHPVWLRAKRPVAAPRPTDCTVAPRVARDGAHCARLPYQRREG